MYDMNHRRSKQQRDNAYQGDQCNHSQVETLNVPWDWPLERCRDPSNDGANQYQNYRHDDTVDEPNQDTT